MSNRRRRENGEEDDGWRLPPRRRRIVEVDEQKGDVPDEQKGSVPDEQKNSAFNGPRSGVFGGVYDLVPDDDDTDDEGDSNFWRAEDIEEMRREEEEQRRRQEREEERRLEEELDDDPPEIYPTDEQARLDEQMKDRYADTRTETYDRMNAAREGLHEMNMELQRNMQPNNDSRPVFGDEVRAIAQRVNPDNPQMYIDHVNRHPRYQRALHHMHRMGRALRQPVDTYDRLRTIFDRSEDDRLRRIARARADGREALRMRDERRRLDDERIWNEAIAQLERDLVVEYPEHFGMGYRFS